MSREMEGKKEYYLGLDMGTNSVGWAVTNPDYQIIKKNRRALWGIRLFDEAKTAEERRMFRTARRRTQRRALRIDLLQQLFAPYICAKDPGFFQRLNDSRYWKEDKAVQQPNSLFNDSDYTDKDFHKEYPTIYHLRQALMTESKTFDIRLVYLAIHHIMKHRGHALFQSLGNSEDQSLGFHDMFLAFEEAWDAMDTGIALKNQEEELLNVLKDKKLYVRQKTFKIAYYLYDQEAQSKKSVKAAAVLLAGGKAALSDLFGDEELKTSDNNKISFSDPAYEEREESLQSELGERFDILEAVKNLYNAGLLAELMGNHKYLSEAKIDIYEQHKKDLAVLKRVFKAQPHIFDSLFKGEEKCSYSAYIGTYKIGGQKQNVDKKCTAEDFYAYVQKLLKSVPESKDKNYIIERLEERDFLPKAVSKQNGVIPYQLHEQELSLILTNAQHYLPFLSKKDQYGTVKDKIIKLFEFRIPYYVGPLNVQKDQFAWAVRKDTEGHVYPWNFEEKIDIEGSAEKFITNMTNQCTYLLAEDVLPKNSLLYTEYMVLNELNNVKLGEKGEKLSPDIKEKIIINLFMKHKKVTQKRFSTYLVCEGIPKDIACSVSGIDGDFKASLAPWIDFTRIFGENKPSRECIEGIIRDITLFGADRKMLVKRLTAKYSDISADQIKQLVKLKYDGWGRLSEKFLTDIIPTPGPGVHAEEFFDKMTGEGMNIITALRKTSHNLMELLSNQYGYSQSISTLNKQHLSEDDSIKKMIQDMRLSPAVVRPVIQTVKIVKEVKKIMGAAPAKIFVEMARGGENVKKRTQSRKEKLLELYKNCEDDTRNWSDEISKYTDDQLRRDQLYLYYTQMGRCMYTGESIDLRELTDKNTYDIDHIYPQSLTADDSLDNRVLVKKTVNSKKSDTYPIAEDIRKNMRSFWRQLLDKELISKRKYQRLVRNTVLTEDEKADFIGRQLVETRQSTKAVTSILQQTVPEARIVYAKAGNVSRFRQYFEFIKVRDVNDFHHAKDAYLNIVVGNVYDTKFTANPARFLKGTNPVYSLNKAMYKFPVIRGNVTAWVPGDEGTIATVSHWMSKNNILFTRRVFEQHGGLFKQIPMKKGHGQVPLKGGDSPLQDISKYGGYNKAAVAYFMYVRGTSKGKEIYRIESVPVYFAGKLRDLDAKKEYCQQVWDKIGKGYANPEILIPQIKINTLFDIDGYKMHLSGKSDDRLLFKNAVQLCLSERDNILIKRIMKWIMKMKGCKAEHITSYDHISEEDTIYLYNLFENKLLNSVYKQEPCAAVKSMLNGKVHFLDLNIEKRCHVLSEILHIFQCNPVLANLSEMGESKATGELRISCNFSGRFNKNKINLITQSTTGFFEKKISLVPFERS